MRNIKVATKIWLVVGLAWLVGTGTSAFLLYREAALASAYDALISHELLQRHQVSLLQLTFKKQVQEWKDLLLRGSDPEMLRKYSQAFHEKEVLVKNLAAELMQAITDPELRSRLAEFRSAHDTMSTRYAEALKTFTENGGKYPQVPDSMVKGVDRAPTDRLDQVAALLTARADTLIQAQQARLANERRISIIVLVLCFVAVGLLSSVMVRDLNARLRRTVASLTDGAGQIVSAAGQVGSSSQALAQGASEQAAALEQTSASSQEMASMTTRNAENSRQSADLMAAVDRHVAEGNRMLDQMLTSMKEIGSSSDKISRIIKVIDEIAFQTNILALNAAVEAARAGEAGMGFAVVADEVRNLAQRSAQAAKDTAALIEESIGRSSEGSSKLEQVAAAIRAITESASQVKTLVDEVHLSSDEQAKGIEQISKAIAQMEQVTQKAAAGAEQSASASEQLNAQSETMRQIVGELRAMVD